MSLRLRIAGKTYPGGMTLLGGTSLDLGRGEAVAVIGPSGCGKTTLLRIAAGLDTDFAGERRWSPAPRLGCVFQQPLLLPWRTVAQNLWIVRPDRARAMALLDRLGVAGVAGAFPGRISLGQARRVALARALLVEPDALLLDEPFASLDAVAVGCARDAVAQARRERPIAMLLVTHDPAEAGLADRTLRVA